MSGVTDTVHPFDAALDLQPLEPGRLRGRTEPRWTNMVGPFGGITAATLLHAIELQPDRIGEPLALTVNYAAPIADGDLDITAWATCTNRTNQHWTVELRQDGKATTTATAVFAMRRDTWADTEAAPPAAPEPETLAPTNFGDVVVWANNYDMRFAAGAVPLDAEPSASSTTTLWLRDAAGRPLDHAGLASACDVFYPRVFLRHGGFRPAGTVSLTTYFHADAAALAAVGAEFVLGTVSANRFAGGYFDQSAQLWSRAGTLLATSHQIVYYKA